MEKEDWSDLQKYSRRRINDNKRYIRITSRGMIHFGTCIDVDNKNIKDMNYVVLHFSKKMNSIIIEFVKEKVDGAMKLSLNTKSANQRSFCLKSFLKFFQIKDFANCYEYEFVNLPNKEIAISIKLDKIVI